MPVYAKTKLVIEDLCFAHTPREKPVIQLTYSGPNPQKIYPKLKEILRKELAVPEHLIEEKEYHWDRSKIPEKFSAKLDVIKEMDNLSYIFIEIEVKGEIKPSKEFGSEGKFTINIDSVLRTEYPQDTIIERSLFYEFFRNIYHKVIYKRKREEYLAQCRELVTRLVTSLKAFFEILPK